jgi:patatin-like phospholipase/acyl hydrolase
MKIKLFCIMLVCSLYSTTSNAYICSLSGWLYSGISYISQSFSDWYWPQNTNINPAQSQPYLRFENKIFSVAPCDDDCSHKVFILTIDGGGIRGVIPARILAEIERLMGGVHLSELFNVFGGTSTGGLIVLSANMPNKERPYLPLYNAQEILDLYMEKKENIFDKTSIFCLPGIKSPLYKSAQKTIFCKESFGETRLSELLNPCFVVVDNVTKGDTELYGSHNAFLGETFNRCVWKAADTTSAAPVFFAGIIEDDDDADLLRDGGLSANNPAALALDEARKLFPNKKDEDFILVSIGTGTNKIKSSQQDLTILHAADLIGGFMEGASNAVDRQMRAQLGDNYFRFQTLLDKVSTDDISDDYIIDMIEAAEKTIASNRIILERLARLWEHQFEKTGKHKHSNHSYSEWQNCQNLAMQNLALDWPDLNLIQNWTYGAIEGICGTKKRN